jgi:hypothetical protein
MIVETFFLTEEKRAIRTQSFQDLFSKASFFEGIFFEGIGARLSDGVLWRIPTTAGLDISCGAAFRWRTPRGTVGSMPPPWWRYPRLTS